MIKRTFKWKDLKLGMKLSISFGMLISIFSILYFAVLIDKQAIQKTAFDLGEDYIPLVGITYSMEQLTDETMLELQGFPLGEENNEFQMARSHITKMGQYSEQADSLITTSQSLTKFENPSKHISEKIREFTQYTEEMAMLNGSIRQLCRQLDSTYTVFDSLSYELILILYSDFRGKLNDPNASNDELVKQYKLTKMVDAIFDKGNVGRREVLQAVFHKNPQLIEDANLLHFRHIFKLIEMMYSKADSQSKRLLDQIEENSLSYQRNMLVLAKYIDRYKCSEDKMEESAFIILSEVHNISSESNKFTAQASLETITLLKSSTRFLVIGLILSQLMAILFSIKTTLNITLPIRKVADFAEKVASGVMSPKVDVDQKNEIGILAEAINNMQFKLRDNDQTIKLVERKIVDSILETEQKERKRFAEDLHDGLGPLLSTIKLYINSFASKRNNPKQRQLMLEKANELIDEAIADTKNIANNMMPILLDDYGLEVALKSFFNHLKNTNSLDIQFHCVSTGARPDPKIESTLYSTILELTNNTLKHAKATCVILEIKQNNDKFEVVYQDDGIGCDLEYIFNNSPRHLGLKNIVDRILSINGNIDFWSGKNMGLKASILI